MDWLTQAWSEQKIELLAIGALIAFILIVIIYVAFFRTKKPKKRTKIPIDEIFLQKRNNLPTKDKILDAMVHFSAYPSFIAIITHVLDEFTLEYLYTYGELAKALPLLIDFPKSGEGLTPSQRGAMMTIVRIFMTSEFITEKCDDLLESHFDKFLEETGDE